MSADAFLQHIWYRKTPSWISNLLLPLSWLFRAIVALRRALYSSGLARQYKLTKPVVVVGNISVGGTGKTPFTIWLANSLEHEGGLRVGIVLRGYGAEPPSLPYVVDARVEWQRAGDEAMVIASSSSAIVVIDPDRVRAAQKAIELGAEIVLSDDGLQHLRLGRDFEIAVIDSARLLGNGRMLPAGPLRESASRLAKVDCRVVMHRGDASANSRGTQSVGHTIEAHAILEAVRSLTTSTSRALSEFCGQRVHAVAGIGNPAAFFSMLREAGLQVIEHAFPDHAPFSREDLAFADDLPILMTQKDAVRCHAFADGRMWAVHMELQVDTRAASVLLDEIKEIVVRRSEGSTRK